ncbi:hypothetical protein [Actinotalea sp. Marseille-Q4924]|uniref:hypothetical protein n=1 Tax=Actinotalea sp. Marseille-Q4924 TaxID=2866571 RepID=UPI001CE451E4|nr:hypothetical protein [Actinotalea sp. Marseille-Q4924]
MEWHTVVAVVFTVLSVAANALALGAIRESVRQGGTGARRWLSTSLRRALARLGVNRSVTVHVGSAAGSVAAVGEASGYALPSHLAEALRGYIQATRKELDRLAETDLEHARRLADLEAARAALEARVVKHDEDAQAATGYVIAGAIFAVLALLAQAFC